MMLAVLAGHGRYAHITTLRCDGVLPELLDMTKIVSEDAVNVKDNDHKSLYAIAL